MIFSSSSIVAFFLRLLALQDMTCTFPFTYPKLGTTLSNDGEWCANTPTALCNFIPNTGQYSGIFISSAVMSQGNPALAALLLYS